jgi:hypothetical protein
MKDLLDISEKENQSAKNDRDKLQMDLNQALTQITELNKNLEKCQKEKDSLVQSQNAEIEKKDKKLQEITSRVNKYYFNSET